MVGSESPVSHLLTAWRETPRDSATNSWVILQRVRWSFRVSARVLRTAAVSFLTSRALVLTLM